MSAITLKVNGRAHTLDLDPATIWNCAALSLVAVLIDRPDEEATGTSETAITVIAAAIGNAIFDATGMRLRQLLLTAERVKAALNARS